ncbi:MAG TPA: O-antigen ligase family protein [Bryobacteraceae bacterium]|nr:O-antigen ligase family protein [Bryobacteraceae bacterium]
MTSHDEGALRRAALLLAGGSAAAVLFSIAVSHILLGAAIVAIIAARIRLRVPPIAVPLLAFIGWTLVSLAASPDPRAGLPQVRKFYVWLTLIAIYSTFRNVRDVRTLLIVWTTLATASGLWSFVQFWRKQTEAVAEHSDFYMYYVANRVTGFMSHWMTFSAEQMMAALMLSALLIFAAVSRFWWMAVAVIGSSIAIAWTRSVWLAFVIGLIYLVAVWRPKFLLAVPVLLGLAVVAAPDAVGRRVTSIWNPNRNADSNDHRRITLLTGLEMIKSHPLTGTGPEIVGRDFMKYVPAHIPKPLPSGFYGHLHNLYVQYAAERGIPALLALLALVGKVLVDFARAVRRAGPEKRLERAVLHGAIACILAILVEGFFELNLGDTEVLTMFLAVVAAGYIASRDVLSAA